MYNICIFNGDMSRGGGTERITQILANALAEATDYNIYVLNVSNEKGISYFPLNERVRMKTLNSGSYFEKVFSLRRFLRQNRIHILVDVDVMLGLYAFPAALFLPKVKIVSWEMFNIRNDIGSSLTKRVRQYALKHGAYYVTQTKRDMDAFLHEMVVHSPITFIYNPCDSVVSKTPYRMDSRVIMTAGHFFRTKGYDLAVEVAHILFQKHPEWSWKFYGDGVQMDNVRQRVKEYSLEKNVIFCGRVSDLSVAYDEGAIYVMTSRLEGFGLVLTEAKTHKLPTVAFDVEFGPGEIIDDGISGYLIPPFEIEHMAEKISYLIEHPEIRAAFSEQAPDNLPKFSKDGFVSAWINLIETLLK